MEKDYEGLGYFLFKVVSKEEYANLCGPASVTDEFQFEEDGFQYQAEPGPASVTDEFQFEEDGFQYQAEPSKGRGASKGDSVEVGVLARMFSALADLARIIRDVLSI